jgi:2-haloacid dehalogenase
VSAPRLVTFDVYAALVDYESGLLPHMAGICADQALARSLLRSWRAKQLEYAQISNSLQGERIPFRLITLRALEYTMAGAGRTLSGGDLARLLAAWDSLEPWPEALGVLAALQHRGYRIGLLSNGDEDMLRVLVGSWSVGFDHVFASDRAGFYKPHPAIYALPMRMLALGRDEVLHVAGSGNDVLGAKSAGLACAWSNRSNERLIDPGVHPDHDMRDLTGLLAIL